MKRRFRASNPKTRTGCITCKERRKKCDEQRPRCQNCIRLGLKCKEPSDLFRIVDVTRQKLARVSDNDSDDFAVYESPEQRGVIQDASIPGDGIVNSMIQPIAPSTPCLQPIWSSPTTPIFSQTSCLEAHLLHHYTHRMSTVLINVDSPSNPLRRVLIPRAVISPMLMNALYATTAFHVFTGNDDADFQTASLRYYDKAASALQRQIADVQRQTSGADLELLLLTSIFLCKYEIISGSRASNWRAHLKGVQDMLGVFQRSHSKLSKETVSYVQSFISYHSCIAGITRLAIPSSVIASEQSDAQAEQDDGGHEIDPYMGISSHLISLLHTATETIMLDCSIESNQAQMMDNIARITDGIELDQQGSRFDKLRDEHSPETMDRLNHIANAYRNALIVYLHIIFDAVQNNDKARAPFTLDCSSKRNRLTYSKDEAICACVHEMLQVPKDSSCIVGLVPLLFIVASETKNRVEFEFALERLTCIWKGACLGNIGTALELLRKIQQSNSSDWRQVLRGCEWDLIVT